MVEIDPQLHPGSSKIRGALGCVGIIQLRDDAIKIGQIGV